MYDLRVILDLWYLHYTLEVLGGENGMGKFAFYCCGYRRKVCLARCRIAQAHERRHPLLGWPVDMELVRPFFFAALVQRPACVETQLDWVGIFNGGERMALSLGLLGVSILQGLFVSFLSYHYILLSPLESWLALHCMGLYGVIY